MGDEERETGSLFMQKMDTLFLLSEACDLIQAIMGKVRVRNGQFMIGQRGVM